MERGRVEGTGERGRQGPEPRLVRSVIFVKVGCYSCCWLYRREVRQPGSDRWERGNERAVYVYEERRKRRKRWRYRERRRRRSVGMG